MLYQTIALGLFYYFLNQYIRLSKIFRVLNVLFINSDSIFNEFDIHQNNFSNS